MHARLSTRVSLCTSSRIAMLLCARDRERVEGFREVLFVQMRLGRGGWRCLKSGYVVGSAADNEGFVLFFVVLCLIPPASAYRAASVGKCAAVLPVNLHF